MIFTFYSYKGGVGRSMALANVAHWLYLRGLDVVLVDWDLEAPGLENFFCRSEEELEHIRSHLGIIDLLNSYRRQFPYLPPDTPFSRLQPINSYICEVKPSVENARSEPGDAARGRLRLLTAGWRSGSRFSEYAEAVQAFDWAAFYERYRGEEYFNWFRGQLRSLGDVVLVDSRTGVSEMSGVCTRQLADVVVVMVVPNTQNLSGALEMVGSFVSKALEQARGRALPVVILPARVDDADSKGYEEFRRRFVSETRPHTPPVFTEWKREPWDLAIPYKAQYSYQESLVTGANDANEQLEQSYKHLAAHLALFASEGDPLWVACEPELRVLAARAGKDITSSPWRGAEMALERLGSAAEARPVLLRLVNLSAQSPDLDTRRRASPDEFEVGEAREILARLASIGIVAPVSGEETFELVHESLAKNWPRLRQWIEGERPFLFWRQDLADQARKWRDSGKDEALLLRGTILEDARRASEGRADQLNALETEFLAGSLAAEAARKQAELEQKEQAQRALEEAENKRRQDLEEAQRERRRALQKAGRRRLRFAMALSGTALALATVVVWWFYSRTDSYQAESVLAAGTQLEAAPGEAQAWRTALILSGHVQEALAAIRRIPSGPDRAGALANAAVLLARCGRRAEADRVAAEALDLQQSGLSPEDAAQSLADLLARLYGGGLGPYPAEVTLLTNVRKLEPWARLAVLERLLPFPGCGQARVEYFEAASNLPPSKEQADKLLTLLESARDRDLDLAWQAVTAAVKEAYFTRDAELRSRVLLALARLDPAPGQWQKAADAARAVSLPAPRATALAAVARASRPSDAIYAESLWKDAQMLASELPPEQRLEIYASLVNPPDDWGRETAAQALNAASGIEQPQARALALANFASQAFRAGLVDQARDAAETSLKAYRTAFSDNLAGALELIPMLSPDSATLLARQINTPQAWLALSKDGRLDQGALEAAQRTAEALPPGTDRSHALALVARAFARNGNLRRSRSLAEACEDPRDRLAAYASILAAYTFASLPELRKIPEAALFS